VHAGEIISTMVLSCGEAQFQVSGYVNTQHRRFSMLIHEVSLHYITLSLAGCCYEFNENYGPLFSKIN